MTQHVYFKTTFIYKIINQPYHNFEDASETHIFQFKLSISQEHSKGKLYNPCC